MYCTQLITSGLFITPNGSRGKVHSIISNEGSSRGVVEVQLHSYFNLSARWGWVANTTPWLLYPWKRDLVPIVQEAGWAIGPVWKGRENLAPTGIRTLNCPACSKPLYRLRTPRCQYPVTGCVISDDELAHSAISTSHKKGR